MRIPSVLSATVLAASIVLATPAFAQESSYTPGTVWNVSGIDIKPGQFENYMDYLATTWKKMQDFSVKEGVAVSYHVFQVSNPRQGEPDLYLAIEYKDYTTNAQKLAHQKKFQAMMDSDSRQMAKAFGERESMRSAAGSMEMQELKLK